MDRVQRFEGSVQAVCTLCQHETAQRLVVTGRPGRIGRSKLHEARHYRFCQECGSRLTVTDGVVPPRGPVSAPGSVHEPVTLPALGPPAMPEQPS